MHAAQSWKGNIGVGLVGAHASFHVCLETELLLSVVPKEGAQQSCMMESTVCSVIAACQTTSIDTMDSKRLLMGRHTHTQTERERPAGQLTGGAGVRLGL